MPRNLSVTQFQTLMRSIPRAVADEMEGAVQEAGESLVRAMRPAVPRGIDGRNELVESVRVEPGRHPLQVKVKAGGPLTTKTSARGRSYDYANANEYGTKEMPARPFFWPTYRLMKRRIRGQIARRMKKGIQRVVPLK